MPKIFLDIETTGLSPLVHRVVCIGMADEEKEPGTIIGENERDLLLKFWEALPDGAELVGFNLSFDIGFLTLRCLRHGISPVKLLAAGKTDLSKLVRDIVPGERYMSLARLAKFFGIEKRTDGAAIPDAWERRDLNAIQEHCEEDVAIVKTLWQILRPLAEEPASQAQKNYLKDLGVPFAPGVTKQQASQLIDRALRGVP